MSTALEQQIDAGVQAVYAKAGTDPLFRQLCMSDPKAAIKVATGLEIPAWLKVRFVDGNDAHLTFVLPKTKSASGELKDEDLEHVSGGLVKLDANPSQQKMKEQQEIAARMQPANTLAAPKGLSGDINSVKRSLGG